MGKQRSELVAWQHLQQWQDRLAAWGRAHPGEPVPEWLIPQPPQKH